MMATQTQPAAPDGDDPTAIVADDKAVNPVESRAIISEFFRPGHKDYAAKDFIQAVRVEAREAKDDTVAGPAPDPETKLAQTAAAPHAEPPTAVVANKAPTVAGLAWSDTDDTEDYDDLLDDDRSTTFWLRLYVATAAAVVLALGVVLWFMLSDHHQPAHNDAIAAHSAPDVVLPSSPAAAAPVPMPSAAPTSVPPPVAAAPPPEPTWGAAPTSTSVQAVPPSTGSDAAFVAAMQADGIQAIGDDWPSLIYNAHRICWGFAHGISRTEILPETKTVSGLPDAGVNDYVGLSIAYYCPQYGGQ
jgi:hypothetical protein